MVNTEIKLIPFLVTKNGEAVYSQQKQDVELYYCSFNNTPGHLSKLPDEDVQD